MPRGIRRRRAARRRGRRLGERASVRPRRTARFSTAHTTAVRSETELRHQPERGGEHAEHGAEGVARVQRGDAARLDGACVASDALHGRQRRAHRRRRRQQQRGTCRRTPRTNARRGDGCAPMSSSSQPADRRHQRRRAPGSTAPIAASHAGVPARGLRAAIDARAQRQRADRQPAEEGRHDREHGRRLRGRATARSAASRRSGSRGAAKPEATISASARRRRRHRLRRGRHVGDDGANGACCTSAAERDRVAPGVEARSGSR